MKKKKEKEEPKYIVRNITYSGDKDFVDCMKAIIKSKLEEN